MGISVEKRSEFGSKVQEVLTKHGDQIIARFGIHDSQNGSGFITKTSICTKQATC